MRSNSDIYDRLGVGKIINAQARASKIGGSVMHEEVLQAMAEATGSFVEISDFLHKASSHLAGLIGVEAALLVNSAAAGLTVTTAACVAGRATDKIYRLPDTRGMKNEVVVHRHQRNQYDCCVRAAGVQLGRVVNWGCAGQESPDCNTPQQIRMKRRNSRFRRGAFFDS